MSMFKKSKILIVDDIEDNILLIEDHLHCELKSQFRTALSGREALEILKNWQPDCILMDVMMPEMDGIAACEKIKNLDTYNDCPIIFLSARSEDFTQIAAYDAGAHDFIQKPTKPKILMKKLEALIKIKNPEKTRNKNEISINTAKHLVYKGDKKIELSKKQFEVLKLLFQNHDIVFSREKIIKKVWGSNYYITARNIDVQIRQIRKAIGQDKISTIKGIGYRFNSE